MEFLTVSSFNDIGSVNSNSSQKESIFKKHIISCCIIFLISDSANIVSGKYHKTKVKQNLQT